MKKPSKFSILIRRSLFKARILYANFLKKSGLDDFVKVYDARVAFFLIIAYIILSIFDLGFIPDWLRLSENKNPSKILEIICTVLASTVAIVIAFVIITFEVLKRKLGSHALKSFFSNRYFVRWITLSVGAIILAAITLIRFDSILNNVGLTLYYYDAIIACFAFVSFFPACYHVLAMGTSHEFVRKAVEEFKDSLGYYNSVEMIGASAKDTWDYLLEFQDNPVIRLRDVGIAYIRDGNSYEGQAVINETTSALVAHLGSTPDSNTIYWDFNRVFIVWRGVISEAIEKHDNRVLESVWRNVRQIFAYIAKNKLQLTDFYQFKQFIDEYLKALTEEGKKDQILMGTQLYTEAMREQFKTNCPPPENIVITYFWDNKPVPDNIDYKDESQWDAITTDYTSKLQKWAEDAMLREDRELFNAINIDLHTLLYEVRTSTINHHMKTYFASSIIWAMYNLSKKALDQQFQEYPMNHFGLSNHDLIEILNHGDDYYSMAISYYCSFFSEFIRSKYTIDYWNLNEIATLGRLLMAKTNGQYQFKEAQLFVISYFSELGKEIVRSEKNSQAVMRALKEQFESVQNYYSKHNAQLDATIVEKFEAIKTEISNLPAINETMPKTELSWPDLSPKDNQ